MNEYRQLRHAMIRLKIAILREVVYPWVKPTVIWLNNFIKRTTDKHSGDRDKP